jgi:hypothetical protein
VAISVKPYVEPLSLATEGEQGLASAIVPSDAYRQLKADLRRYVEGKLVGRSFLISGHRGAGKTTMVRHAVEAVEIEMASELKPCRPIFIPLHGPSILRPLAPKPAGEGASATDLAAEQRERFDFLDRVTSGLYITAAQEFVRCYRRRIRRLHPDSKSFRVQEALEQAAQMQTDLDFKPEPDRLRFYWSKVDALQSGVLFDALPGSGRGFEEIVALLSAWRAMSFFAGSSQQSQASSEESERASSVSLVSVEGKNLLPGLLGLATGTLLWAGLPAQNQPLLSSAISIGGGLAAALTLHFTASRSRTVKQSRQEKFEFSNDPGSLYRILPVLIKRFSRIGLFPVFVVDELDKVEGLDQRMESLLGYLKQFVTENAFFCFLTDRSYHEFLEWNIRADQHGTRSTLFGDRLLVRYTPQDLHDYLADRLDADVAAPQETEAAAVAGYVLSHRSYLHPASLRRQLDRWTGGAGDLTVPPDDLLNRTVYQFDLLMQLTVEVVLQEPDLQEYLSGYSQALIVQDALYYPSRCWRNGLRPDGTFTLEPDALRNYLIEQSRIRREWRPGAPETGVEPPEPDQIVPPAFLRVLHAAALRVMAYLSDPKTLVASARTIRPLEHFPETMRKRLEAVAVDALVKPLAGRNSFRWRFTPQGGSLTLLEAAPSAAPGDEPTAVVRALAAWFDQNPTFGLDLSILERAGILPPTPEWTYIRGALDRIGSGSSPDRQGEDELLIRRYGETLLQRLPQVENALTGASFASTVSPGQTPAEQLADGLRAVALAGVVAPADIRTRFPALPVFSDPLAGHPLELGPRIQSRHQQIRQAVAISTDQLGSLSDRAWAAWRGRFNDWLTQGVVEFPAIAEDLLLAARGMPPASLLTNDLKKMTLRQWSEALLASPAPGWFPAVALTALGYSQTASNLLHGVPASELDAAVRFEWNQRLMDMFSDTSLYKTVLVLADRAAQVSSLWRPVPGVAALWLPQAAAENMAGTLPKVLEGLTAQFDAVLIEVSVTPQQLARRVARDPKTLLPNTLTRLAGGSAPTAYFGPSAMARDATPAVPYVANPATVLAAYQAVEKAGRAGPETPA